jgi:ketosteroid isomerase-like protein
VRGATDAEAAKLSQQRKTIDTFLAALRAADVQGLFAVLDPDLVVNGGAAAPVHGAEVWVKQAMAYSHGARFVQPVLIDGKVGAILAPGGKLSRALALTFKDGKIAQIDVISDPAQLAAMELSVLPD